MFETIELVFHEIIDYAILLIEFAGVAVLIVTVVKAFIGWIKKDPEIRLDLANGIALALEFKMGGEVLRTVIVREWSELIILGAVMLLRAAMTFLIHWEISKEEKKQ